MSKAKKKAPTAPSARAADAPPKTPGEPKIKKIDPGSKQSRVISLLSSPSGTTIAAMTKATGWQQHSVRGFLAGVVRKRLGLRLESEKGGDERTYRIVAKSKAPKSKSRSGRKAA